MSSEEPLTWRVLLGRLTSEPAEKQRIATLLDVHPASITRWVTGKSNPRADYLRAFITVFPGYEQKFIELIHKEIPDFFTKELLNDEPASEIPSAFYSSVLRTYTNSPSAQHPLIRITILQQLLTHLDPFYKGLAASIYQCVPPNPGSYVQSLQEVVGRSNSSWRSPLENRAQFLGIESLPGNAVSHGRPIALQSQATKARVFPAPFVDQEESALAYPISASNRIAGCLYVSSKQANYFTEARQEIVRNYIDLLALTFQPHDFYTPTHFELGIMPPYALQHPYLKNFRVRVLQRLREMQNEKGATMHEAEQAVLKELETQFLHMRYNNRDTV